MVVGLASWLGWRAALRRVIVPPPPQAAILPESFPVRDVAWSIGWACLLIVASLTHVLSPAFFGAGAGAAISKLWSVRKIREFELSDGRRVLRSPRRSPWDRNIPGLYAGEVP